MKCLKIAVITASSLFVCGTAFAECGSTVPVFDVNNLPPDGAMQMCIGGYIGAVGCDQQPMRNSNLGKARIQKILMNRARLNAKGALLEYVKGAEWESTELGEEAYNLTTNGDSDTDTYAGRSARMIKMKSRLISGIFKAAQDVNNNSVTVCMATSLQSESIANTLSQADENKTTDYTGSKQKKDDDTNLNSKWVAPIPNE